MNLYCQNVLRQELLKPDYDGMSCEQAYVWLHELLPNPSGGTFPPRVHERFHPNNWPHVDPGGNVNLTDMHCSACHKSISAFEKSCPHCKECTVCNRIVDATRLNCPGCYSPTFRPTTFHPDDSSRHAPQLARAIHGFPNVIERADFDAAWTTAGRKA